MTALDSTSAGLAESSDAVLVSFQKPRRSAIPAAFRVSSAAFDCRKYVCAVVLGGELRRVGLRGPHREARSAVAERRALELHEIDDGRAGGQGGLGERVDLRAVVAVAEQARAVGERVLVGGEVDPELVGADVRVVADAGAADVGRGALGAGVLDRQAAAGGFLLLAGWEGAAVPGY